MPYGVPKRGRRFFYAPREAAKSLRPIRQAGIARQSDGPALRPVTDRGFHP